MFAYFLILFSVVTRVIPHPAWLNFTAVGSSLLYFGARRPLREMFLPVAALAATDYYLTTYAYGYPFHVSSYLVTWAWYAAIIVLAARMLKANALKTNASIGRVVGASAVSATSFFILSNFAVWVSSGMYPHSATGLATCYVAALPFYRNDLISTTALSVIVFGAPQLVHHLTHSQQPARPAAS
jgi:hypothetical protein